MPLLTAEQIQTLQAETKHLSDGEFPMGREVAETALAALAENERLRAVVSAAEQMRRAVCGDTGFVNAVRQDAGYAYPWPAFDAAETALDAALEAAMEVKE